MSNLTWIGSAVAILITLVIALMVAYVIRQVYLNSQQALDVKMKKHGISKTQNGINVSMGRADQDTFVHKASTNLLNIINEKLPKK
ncbi:hypothetical protein K7432_012000 [Basidiobolus ranarum]|uniref:Uncharacterized protein n=1 Tax=Basidiobolus ranarum TaxID=34480 RepID=A0ABR2VTS8_9FUNG